MLKKSVLFFSCMFLIFICSIGLLFAKVGMVAIRSDNGKLTATIQDAPLKSVCEELSKKAGNENPIWLRGDESLFNEKITGFFSSLTLSESLEHVLKPMNYSLVFMDNTPIGIYLYGKYTGIETNTDPIVVVKKDILKDKRLDISDDILEKLRIVRNVPSPGGPVEISEEIREKLKVSKDVSAPGGKVEMTEEMKMNLKVVKNCPPPCGKKIRKE